MAEVTKITIVPVGRLAERFADEQEFNPNDLPFALGSNVFLEDISQQMKSLDLELWSREYLSKHDVAKVQGWKHALVHRYSEEEYLHSAPEAHSRELVHKMFVGLRVVRPSNVPFQYLHARVKPDGSFDPWGFSRAEMRLTVCGCDTWATIRPVDAKLLVAITPSLLRAYETKCLPITRAVNVLEVGYNSRYLDVKQLLWVTGIEALFTSSTYNGAPTVIRRLRHFLGSKTQIYNPVDFPRFLSMPTLSLKDVLEDIYSVRNRLAHGEWVPEEFMNRPGHQGGTSSYAEILLEATGIALRLALIRILRDSLLEIFGDKDRLDKYFSYDPISGRTPCSF
jgi:hypothetical protein